MSAMSSGPRENVGFLKSGPLPHRSTTDGLIVGLRHRSPVHAVLDGLPTHPQLLGDVSERQNRLCHSEHVAIFPLDLDSVKVYGVKVS